MRMNDLFSQLNAPFAYEEYHVNYEGFVYVSPQSVSDRLNEVLGIFDWSHDILEYKEDHQEFTVAVRGLLKVRDSNTNEWVTRTQFGDKKVMLVTGASTPKAQDFLDAKKAAVSDSLKKCAALFGVASDIYKGRIRAIRPFRSGRKENNTVPDNEMFLAIASYFNIDYSDPRFSSGIVLLPDDYKAFYEEAKQTGIFEGDQRQAWAAWQGEGKHKQNSVLPAYPQPSTQPARPKQIEAVETKLAIAETRNASNEGNSQSNETSSNENFYEFLGLRACAHPETQEGFFWLKFKKADETLDIYAIDQNIMDYIMALDLKEDLREGNKYRLKTKTSDKGKLILRHITSVSSSLSSGEAS